MIRTKQVRNRESEIPLHLMLILPVIITILFRYIPMYWNVMAFQDFVPARGLFGKQKWVGFENFVYFFNMPNFESVLSNTLIIAAFKIVLNLIVPIILALLINEIRNIVFKRSIQTIIYFPHFLSWVILGGIFMQVLSPSNGIVNNILKIIGIEPIFFLASNNWFQPIIIITDVWKEMGFGTIIYLATITGIDPNLYEASIIDGASRWRQTWHITLTGMRHIIVLLSVLSLGNILNAGFDQIFNLSSPIVYKTGDIIDTLVYRVGLENAKYSLATAIGMFKSVISLILISLSYWLSYKYADYKIF